MPGAGMWPDRLAAGHGRLVMLAGAPMGESVWMGRRPSASRQPAGCRGVGPGA